MSCQLKRLKRLVAFCRRGIKLETDEARAEGRPINNVISEGLQHYVWSPEIEKCLGDIEAYRLKRLRGHGKKKQSEHNEFLNGKVIPLVSQSRDAVLHAVAEVMARKDLNH